MIAFFAATPYQIFSAVLIKYQYYREEEADLFILDHFSGSDKWAEHIGTLEIFSDVYHVNDWKIFERIMGDVKNPQKDPWKIRMRVSHAFWKLFYYGGCAAALKKEHIKPEKYSVTFFAIAPHVSNIIGVYTKRRRINILQYGFEDGNQDYLDELDEKWCDIKKLERIMGVPENVYHKDKYWVYRPDQICNRLKYASKVERIFPPDEEVKAMILKIWDIRRSPYIFSKYIFFDTLLEREVLHRIVDPIVETVGKVNFTFKQHPLRKDRPFADNEMKIWPASDVPFEAYLATGNYNDNVLISQYSTACFTPKFIYDQEPIIIFIYRIVPTKEGAEMVESMVNKLISLYEQKGRIYIPKDVDEFCQIIKQINK